MACKAVSGIGESEEEEESSYYDVMMIGKTGQGKSTVGNKFLGIDPDKKELTGVYREGENIDNVILRWNMDDDTDKLPYFEMGKGAASVTKKCKLLSNARNKDRVLDTRGFADSDATRELGVIKGNLQSFRWILQVQREYNLRFSRVLYFFPTRGPPPERADGNFQEEIRVMHSFFGQKIFDVMVIIVTNFGKESYQKIGFSDNDITETKEIFMEAFHSITGTELPQCPPVLYIPLNQTCEKLYRAIVSADVISDKENLYFSPEYPKDRKFGDSEASIKQTLSLSHKEMKQLFRTHRGKAFCFENRCSRCAIKIVQERLPSGREIPVRVVFENGDEEEYDNSYCHLPFIPKHSRLVKFAGGVAHIVVLGTAKIYEKISGKKSWPGFMNSEEVCPSCKKPPGSDGCKAVGQACENGVMDHSKELDTVKILAEPDDEEDEEQVEQVEEQAEEQ